MKRPLLFALLAVLCLPASFLRADEPAEIHLEFVRKLRERGMADLALQHLEKLQKAPPAGLAAQLPIELARTRVSLARQKEPSQRGVLFEQARKEIQAFIDKNPKSPEVSQARVELARLVAYQGQALLSQSIRTEDEKAADALAKKAEGFFKQAGVELKKAADTVSSPEEKVQLLFERGKNFLDQAYTYPLDDNRSRAKLFDEARKALEEVEKIALDVKDVTKIKLNTKNRNPALHLARAWLIKVLYEAETPDRAGDYFKAVMSERVPQAEPGQRWAWYFYIEHIPKDIKSKLSQLARLKLQQKEAKSWLKVFARDRNTPEGYAVRYALAKALLNEAQAISKDPKSAKAKAAKLYNDAQKELTSLAAADNDYTEKAEQLNLQISFHRMGAKTPVEQLKDFEQCELKARYELSKAQDVLASLAKTSPDEREKLIQERKQHFRTAIAAFQRGLYLANAKTPLAKIADARYYLAYAYLTGQDPYRAAIVGEELAKAHPTTKRSAAAAAYALEAYNTIAINTKRPGDLQRMRNLASFVLAQGQGMWKGEAVVEGARYKLAIAAILEKKPLEAITLLEQLSPTYPTYVYAQSQLVLLASSTARKLGDTPKDKKEKLVLLAKARAALARLGKLPDSADPATAQMYFSAQLEKGNSLYGEAFDQARKGKKDLAVKTYAALDAFQADLQKQFDKHARTLPPEAQDGFAGALKRFRNLARYGIVEAQYRAGNYDEVLAPKAAGEVFEQISKLAGKGNEAITVPDAKLTGAILGLAMRASVQKGKIAQAKSILGLLRRLKGDDFGGGDQSGAILQTLVMELKAQIRELKDKQQKKKLEETVKNFSQFLEELAKEPGRKATRDSIVFLASSYASLEKYGEAAKLYAQIPEPKIDLKKKKLTPEEDRQLQDYWMMQVAYGRALRLAKEYDEARKVLSRILTTPKARGRFLAEKEDIHLLEDQGLYGKAVSRWNKYMTNPQMQRAIKTLGSKSVDEQRRIKDLFYECGYQFTYCMYMYGKNHKLEAKRKDYTQRAAARVIRDEGREAWEFVGDRYRALLRSEPMLMEEYNRQKGKAPAGK